MMSQLQSVGANKVETTTSMHSICGHVNTNSKR